MPGNVRPLRPDCRSTETDQRIDHTMSELDAPVDDSPIVLDRLARNLLNGLGDDLSADLADRLAKGRGR